MNMSQVLYKRQITFLVTSQELGNLRDIDNPAQYGERKFLQHTGPTNLALYHITDKSANIIKSIDFARREYSKFKRLFLQTSLRTRF